MTYRPRLPSPDEEPLRSYRVEDARRWLAVIANQLHQKGTRNLCLWRLQDVRPGFRQSTRMLLSTWRGFPQVAGGITLLAVLLVATIRVDVWLPGLMAAALVVFLRRRPVARPARLLLRPVRVGVGLAMMMGLGVLLGNIVHSMAEWGYWTFLAVVLMMAPVMAAIFRTVLIGLIDASPSKVVLSPAVPCDRIGRHFSLWLSPAPVWRSPL